MGVMDKFIQYMKFNDAEDDEYLDDDYLDDDGIIMLDNTMHLISTETEMDFNDVDELSKYMNLLGVFNIVNCFLISSIIL